MDIESGLTGCSAADMRAYVAEHPGCQSGQIAKAIGSTTQRVSNACKKMAARGLLVGTRLDIPGAPRYSYVIGRAALIDRTERARMANRAKPKVDKKIVLRTLLRDSVRTVAPHATCIQSETIEQWQARTGRMPDVLPGFRYVPAPAQPCGARYG